MNSRQLRRITLAAGLLIAAASLLPGSLGDQARRLEPLPLPADAPLHEVKASARPAPPPPQGHPQRWVF